MMKINILEHLPQKTFIYIKLEVRRKLFNKLINTTLTNLSKNLYIKLKNISRYKTGTRAIPLKTFLELVNKSSINLNNFQNKIIIKVGRRGNKLKIGPFLEINDKWVYISELIRGDGSLVRGNNNSRITCFTNKNSILIDFVNKFFLSLGVSRKNIGIYPNVRNHKIKHLIIRSEIISYLLNSFFKIPFGRKGKTPIPNFIKENKNFAVNAIRGIFDAEGSVVYKNWNNQKLRKVIIGMKDDIYLNDIKKILTDMNIKSRLYADKKDMYRLVMGDRRSIIRFYRKIKPLHSERIKKLKMLVESYQNWVSSEDLIPKILKLLLNKNIKRSDIYNALKISSSQAFLCLTKLRKRGLIKVEDKLYTNNGSWFIYGITEAGKSYLKEIDKDFS